MRKQCGLAVAMLLLAVPGALAAEMLEVSLGYSQVIGPVANMSTVIVGDDSVADATLGGGGTIILTGRSIGATNLIVLDERGRELLASPLNVVPLDRRPTTSIRIVKGMSDVQVYVCGRDDGCNAVAVAVAASSAPLVVINESSQSSDNDADNDAPDSGAPVSSDPAAQLSLNP